MRLLAVNKVMLNTLKRLKHLRRFPSFLLSRAGIRSSLKSRIHLKQCSLLWKAILKNICYSMMKLLLSATRKVRRLLLIRTVYEDNKEMVDIIASKFFICYALIESEKFLSMPRELARKYGEKFKYPKRIYQIIDGIEAKPYKLVSKDMKR